MKIISGTEKKINCDTLLLSLGLIPENELSKQIDIKINDLTGGPIVNQYYETTVPGFFACGNCLQVYDTVDVLSIGAKIAGKHAAEHDIKKEGKKERQTIVRPRNGIRYIVPQRIDKPGVIHFSLRVEKPKESANIYISSGKKVIFKKKLPWINPANMVEFDIEINNEILLSNKTLEVTLDER
jgi:hypothetical protein